MSVSFFVSRRDQWRVLSLSGRVDAFSDKRILQNLRQAVASESGGFVALDLKECRFLSLWILKALVDWRRELLAQGGRLVLMSPADPLRRQLEVFVGADLEVYLGWTELDTELFYARSSEPAPLVGWKAQKVSNLRSSDPLA